MSVRYELSYFSLLKFRCVPFENAVLNFCQLFGYSFCGALQLFAMLPVFEALDFFDAIYFCQVCQAVLLVNCCEELLFFYCR